MPLTYENPVLAMDFPDPGVFFDEPSQKYYAYSTNGNGKNVQCGFSDDFCTWHISEHDALPGPYPSWTGKDGFRCWAPEVRRAPEGRPGYLMYFSTHDFNTGVMSIATAYSEQSPLGPFGFVGVGPIVSQGYQGGTIDPQPFFDPASKKTYLIFKNDGNHQQRGMTRIWIQELSLDGLSLVDRPRVLLEPSRSWHKDLIEAPYLVYHSASQTYVLFFSTGFFGNEDYATGYARSKSLFGPYKAEKKPFLATDEKRRIRGPGGIAVVENGPEGNWMVAFHAHDKQGGGARQLCVHRVDWTAEGKPLLAGKAAHYGVRLTMGQEDQAYQEQSRDGHDVHPAARTSPGGDNKSKPMARVKQWIKDY